MCSVCDKSDRNDGLFRRTLGNWAPRRAYRLPCGEVCLSRVPIPGARRVKDNLGRENHVDSGNVKYVEIEKKDKEKKNYGTSDRVLRPRGEGNKVIKEGK